MDRLRGGVVPGLFFAAAAVTLTWPLAFSPGESFSVRGDYYVGLWNAWWVRTAIFELGTSPYWTDYVHYPLGVSLARHTLYPLNALAVALTGLAVGLAEGWKLVLLIHFWLSGWFFFLFSRELGRSAAGALLAGLVWSFSPIHLYYLPQLNVASAEFLPLAGLFMVRCYRTPGTRSALGVAAAAGLLATSSSYYLVYAAMLGGLLLLGGRSWCPERDFLPAAGRLARAGLLAAAVVALSSFRLLVEPLSAQAGVLQDRIDRSNDLLGFLWVGGPETLIVSWPSMLGYSTLAVVALGFRFDRRRLFWLASGLLFLLLSLGPRLHVGGELWDQPLPDRWLSEAPLFWMLRSPDRMFVMVQFCVCVLLAQSWHEVTGRWRSRGARAAATAACASLLCLELRAAPLETFVDPYPPSLAKLAREEGRVVANLPAFGMDPRAARSNRDQTLHRKRITDGYLTSFAFEDRHVEATRDWRRAHGRLLSGEPDQLLELARERDVDLFVVYKSFLRAREKEQELDLEGPIWTPFTWRARALVGIRQRGHLEPAPRPSDVLEREARALGEVCGRPIFEDEAVAVYRVPARTSPAEARAASGDASPVRP